MDPPLLAQREAAMERAGFTESEKRVYRELDRRLVAVTQFTVNVDDIPLKED